MRFGLKEEPTLGKVTRLFACGTLIAASLWFAIPTKTTKTVSAETAPDAVGSFADSQYSTANDPGESGAWASRGR